MRHHASHQVLTTGEVAVSTVVAGCALITILTTLTTVACSTTSTTQRSACDVACLLAPDRDMLTPQEQIAVEFLDRLSADHHWIDDEFYRRLGEHFTAAQIVELGFTCASAMGLHRFIHTLDIYGDSAPVIEYSPDQIDRAS